MLTVYTTESCAYCPMVKKFLRMRGAEFTEVDVTNDIKKRDELYKQTGQLTVPITTNGKDFIIGFKPALLANLIK